MDPKQPPRQDDPQDEGPQWRGGNQIELLINGDEFYPRVFDAIRHAKREVIIETFILFDDKVGRGLHEVMCEAAWRGVEVIITTDGYGSPDLSREYLDSLALAGVRMRFYDPRPMFMGMRTNVFRRLHRKIVVIDQELAFVGGMNFSADHLLDFGAEAKQDYTVAVRGPVVADIHAFAREAISHREETRRWWGRRSPKPSSGPTGDAQVLFVWRDNDQHRTDIEVQYLEALRHAEHEVIIANAYFFPGYRLLREMRAAAARGVKVRLILQGEPDMPIVKTAAGWLHDFLLRSGIEIHEYCRRPLHGKVAVMDDAWSTVGSSNLDPLSLSLNLEANLIIQDRAFNEQLRGHLHELMRADCRQIQFDQVPKQTIWRVLQRLVVFHFLRHFPAWAGWLPAHTPKLKWVKPPPQAKAETGDTLPSPARSEP